jgi:hypothetical protein
MPGNMLNQKNGKRRGPSLLLLTTVLVACLYGGVLGWLALTDSRHAGKPLVALTLAPEKPAPDLPLRTDLGADANGKAHGTESGDANSDTPGATPVSPDTSGQDKLSPDELALLEAAKKIRNGEAADNSDSEDGDAASMGDVRIVGAQAVTDDKGETPNTPALTGSVPPMPRVPDPALVAVSPQGPLPIVAKDGRKAWKVYARPLPAGIGSGPRIALVVSGLGISESATAHAIKALPPEVTLSFAPYGANLQKWITEARAAGHEVLLELPMEPFGYPQNDPGPYTLLTSLKPSENISRLEWLLSRFTGYVGVMNYQGTRFTSSHDALSPVLSALKSRGLMYVDNGASTRTLAPKISHDIDLPLAVGGRSIDPVQTPDVMAQSFAALEAGAKNSGTAIGVASGLPVTVDALTGWAATLAAKNITLVPVSAAAK